MLSVTAVKILLGASSGGGTDSPKRTTLSKKFLEDSNTAQMSRDVQRRADRFALYSIADARYRKI